MKSERGEIMQNVNEPTKKSGLLERYKPRIVKRDGILIALVDAPFDGKIRAELTGEDQDKTLHLTKLLRPGGADDAAVFVMLKELLRGVEEELNEQGMKLGHIEIPVNGDQDLSHLFHLKGIEEIFGMDETKQAKELYNPRPTEEQKRRKGERLESISFTLKELTERFKEYEKRHGTIKL